jgi:hypothetical protein
MYLTILGGLVKLVSLLSGLAGWLHDRQEQTIGATNQTVKSQAVALKTISAVLAAPHDDTVAELSKRLQAGKL